MSNPSNIDVMFVNPLYTPPPRGKSKEKSPWELCLKTSKIIVVLCAIWYHLQNLKNVKNTHGGLLLLVFILLLRPATLLKVMLLHGYYSRVLNCSNGTKN